MGRKSAIRRLPPELLQEINRLLSGGRATLDEILEHLRGLGVEDVSRSALGRHKKKMDAVLERLRQSRDFAETIASKLGPEATEGRQGRALVQMLQAMAGEYMMRRMEDADEETHIKELVALGRTIKDAAQASRTSQDYEMKIREQVAKEEQAKVEKAVAAVIGDPESAKLSPEEALQRVRAVYRGEA